jgi:hypothetical protein
MIVELIKNAHNKRIVSSRFFHPSKIKVHFLSDIKVRGQYLPNKAYAKYCLKDYLITQ